MCNSKIGRVTIFSAMLTLLAGCPPGGDDTPGDGTSSESPGVTQSPDPGTANNTPTAVAGPITLSGTISAVDDETGAAVSTELYEACFGALALSFLESPADVQHPERKITQSSPGSFETVYDPQFGNIYLSLTADLNNDQLIGYFDYYIEYTGNPVNVGRQDIQGLDLVIEVPLCEGECCGGGTGSGSGWGTGSGGGGGGTYNYTTFSGVTRIDENADDLQSLPTAVSVFDSDWLGPYTSFVRSEPGDFSLGIPYEEVDEINLLAYLDTDENGLFEPSDHLAQGPGNPYGVSIDPEHGIEILFTAMPYQFEEPPLPVYLPVTADVSFDGEHEGAIFVYISRDQPRGTLVSEGVIADAGPILLRAPQNTENLWLWGVVDEDGDGFGDYNTEPWGKSGPFRVINEPVSGLQLTLIPQDEHTPTNSPTDGPSLTPDLNTPSPTASPTTPMASTSAPTSEVTSEATVAPETPIAATATAIPTPEPTATQIQATPTGTAIPTNSSLSGTVSSDLTTESGDLLRIGLQAKEPAPDTPWIVFTYSVAEGFPIDWNATSLRAGDYQIFAYLDRGGDNPDGPSANDPDGYYTTNPDSGPDWIVLDPGESKTGLNFTLE